MSFQDIIQQLLWQNICTVREAAVVMGKDTQTIYGYKNQGHEPTYSSIRALNSFLIRDKQCYIIQDQMRPDIENQPLFNEMRGLMRSPQSIEVCDTMRNVIDRLEAEIRIK